MVWVVGVFEEEAIPLSKGHEKWGTCYDFGTFGIIGKGVMDAEAHHFGGF
jgi:hypothetical protein